MLNTQAPAGAPIEHLVIVGGGTAGWMTAAAISKVFKGSPMKITLVESSEIGTVGVGEATIPDIINFNDAIGVDEQAFLKFTGGTFKLGIQFVDWSKPGESYFHPFGRYGRSIGSVPFFHHWQRSQALGKGRPISNYSLPIQACQENRFILPANVPNSPLSEIGYAYHFDASLYAQFLRQLSEGCGVRRVDAKVTGVIKNPSTGHIQTLSLDTGETIDADFFIDCSGFRGLLIEQSLHTGYDDWSHILPCDSAVAVASPRLDPLPPYTRAIARDAGWQWRIPLQHRTGNGYVYCSGYVSDDQAIETLLSNVEGPVTSDPKIIRFKTGMRRKLWNKNVVALGLSGGFLEPLESTSIHLIYAALANFLGLFPSKKIEPELSEKFNDLQLKNFTNVRDLLIFHYHFNRRDGDFWNHCRTIDIPERLRRKVDLYKNGGRIFREDNELFNDTSWVSVFQGQGVYTNSYNPIADVIPERELARRLEEVYQVIDNSCRSMPRHSDFVAKYCPSSPR